MAGQAERGGGMMRADTDGDARSPARNFSRNPTPALPGSMPIGDGVISADEMKAQAEAARERRGGFNRGNGDIPPSNVASQGGGMLERLDANHDGQVTRDEYRAQASATFDRLDTNHDGFLDQSEMGAMRGRMGGGAGMAPPPGAPMPPPPGAEGGPRGRHGHGMGGKMMERADADHDGRISLAEYQAQAKTRFDRLDTNHDGFNRQGRTGRGARGR